MTLTLKHRPEEDERNRLMVFAIRRLLPVIRSDYHQHLSEQRYPAMSEAMRKRVDAFGEFIAYAEATLPPEPTGDPL